MLGRTTLLLLLAALPAAAAPKPDPLTAARQFYNVGQYERAIEAAQQAAALRPNAMASARLIMARSRLERYRASATSQDLDQARSDFRAIDTAMLDPRERVELQVGLGELLYLEDRFGAAAELLAPVVEQQATLAPDARERAIDWWATALDRQAQSVPVSDRPPIYQRITARMEEELRRDAASTPAGYWLSAAARAAGDLDRAWATAMAGWVRATMARDKGAALRNDLDKLVTQGIIPDRSARVAARERRQTSTTLAAEWEAFKTAWR